MQAHRKLPVSKPLRLLLAEDNPLNAATGCAMMRKLGHQVELVHDGKQAWERLQSTAFDAVLLDLSMPFLSGNDVVRLLREAEQQTGTHQIVIAVTANALQGSREQLLREGFDGYITKPVDLQQLSEELSRLVTSY